MKKMFIVMAALALLGLVSCEKEVMLKVTTAGVTAEGEKGMTEGVEGVSTVEF